MTGQIIVVTGAAGALGAAVTAHAAGLGHKVIAVDRERPTEGTQHAFVEVDLSTFSLVDQAMQTIHETHGPIGALINLAGGFRFERLIDGDPKTWDEMFAMNLKTTINACKAAAPFLTAHPVPAIVNVGADSATRAGDGMGAYAASKAGVAKLTESLAAELKYRARVNAVLPTIIDTPANRAAMPLSQFKDWVRAEDLASVILFLASPAAGAITGALVPVRAWT